MTRRVAGGPDPDGSGIRMLTALACALALTAAFVASCGDHHNAATPTASAIDYRTVPAASRSRSDACPLSSSTCHAVPAPTYTVHTATSAATPPGTRIVHTPLLRPVVTATKTSRHAHTTGRNPTPTPTGTTRRHWSPDPVAAGLNWHALAACESGNQPHAVSADGLYFGLYQFDLSTWASYGGAGNPAHASPAEQLHRAELLYAVRGREPWPICGRWL